jgi:hypothetical protein
MAIKVLSPIYLEKYNINLTNMILSFKGSCRLYYNTNNQNERIYWISGSLFYYADRDKQFLHLENIDVTCPDNLSGNPLDYLYSIIKNRYEQIEDI